MKLFQSLFYQPVLLTTLGLLTQSPPVLADLQTSENYVLSATVLSNGSHVALKGWIGVQKNTCPPT